MSDHSIEVEVKSLLGNAGNATKLIEKMRLADPGFSEISKHKQLNHYFVGNSLKNLLETLGTYLPAEKKNELEKLVSKVKDFSVRTRLADDKAILVIKASIDDTTSSNGTARIEFESEVNLSLDELDKLVLESGFNYQAKWSRERQEFKFKDLKVSVDKNAGYGYLAEFEKVISDQQQAETVKAAIRKLMVDLGVQELSQDRLARMFDYYNANWQDYYATEKIFNIE